MHGFDPAADVGRSLLGDKRRTARAARLVDLLKATPSASLPSVAGEADLEGCYRLLSNPAVTHEGLLSGHQEATTERAVACGSVFVIHDTTELSYALRGGHERVGMSKLSTNRQGCFVHNSLVVSACASRTPLGLVRMQPFVHRSGLKGASDDVVEFWDSGGGLYDNEHQRWPEAVRETKKQLAECKQVIHLCDREGDSYELLSTFVSENADFVVRLSQDRSVDSPDEQISRISDALNAVSWLSATRKADVNGRTGPRSAKDRAIYPDRVTRQAELSVRAAQVTIKRPGNRSDLADLPGVLALHVVQVRELNPPAEQDPIEWLLITALPIGDAAEIWAVVDAYRARWIIEEYHKALKTGCAIENRQPESAWAILNMLALTAPVAIDLLRIRTIADADPTRPAKEVVDPDSIGILRAVVKERHKLPPNPTIAQYRDALAAFGGHLKRNGRPGWLTLMRGTMRLNDCMIGARSAWADGAPKCDQ